MIKHKYSIPKVFEFNTSFDGVLDGLRLIMVRGFTFSIPSGSTVTGIKVQVKHDNRFTNCLAHLRMGDGDLSTSLGNVLRWSSITNKQTTYGTGKNDLWGNENIFPSLINGGSLSFALLASEELDENILKNFKMTVYYK